jgi:hypothetical protein
VGTLRVPACEEASSFWPKLRPSVLAAESLNQSHNRTN